MRANGGALCAAALFFPARGRHCNARRRRLEREDGGAISADGFGQASGLVEDVAEIEICQRITRVGFDRLPIKMFSLHEIVAVVMNGS